MPLPIVTGAFGVVGAIAAGFTALISFMAAKMTAKVGIVASAVVVMISLTAGLIFALETLADTLAASLPSGVVAFSQAVIPTNLNACISVIVTAMVARWVYDRHMQIIGMLTSG